MAFQTINGYDVEHASNLALYDNLFPSLQHINGKGCIDTYTKTEDIDRVMYIDIMRVLPWGVNFRKVGSQNNGAYHNAANNNVYANAPQSTHYTIPVDLICDRGVSLSSVQSYSNPVELQAVVVNQIVNSVTLSINVITFAKQIEAYFRNGDNFDIAKTHNKGAIVAGDITTAEIANAVFGYDPNALPTAASSATNAFLKANAKFDDGIPEIGALYIPEDARQGFITPALNVVMKNQYMQNASDVAARILASGFMNPYKGNGSDTPETRVDSRTMICGMYDGVDLFKFNSITRNYVYTSLGILGTADDTVYAAVRTLLNQLEGFIVYGPGTVRGIVGPTITANAIWYGGVYLCPHAKIGVEVLNGKSIKGIVNAGASLASAWTAANIAAIMNAVTFTAVDGITVTGSTVVSGMNTGTTN